MGCLSRLVNPRFLHPLANALSLGPQTEFDLQAMFFRAVPNRNLSCRSLHILLDLAKQGGLIVFENGMWRMVEHGDIDHAVIDCLSAWCAPQFTNEDLFRNRCAVYLDRGFLSAKAEFTPLPELASRLSLTATEWARLISGPCDIRQLTGWSSKHADADFLMLYRSADTAPITDDSDVSPRIARSLLANLPTTPSDLLLSIYRARAVWRDQMVAFLGDVTLRDLAGFIIYAKDLLDLLFWGSSFPLRSVVPPEHLLTVSERLRRFGLRAEDLSGVWRILPSIYRAFSRLSWGIRYLSNNLSHPDPVEPNATSFLKVCNLPISKLSALSTSRSGHSLLTLTRPIRVIHRALANWRGRMEIVSVVKGWGSAIVADTLDDKLLRREFAERIKRLNVLSSVYVLDAMAHEMPAPNFPFQDDEVLRSAGLIASFANFFESQQGRAYAEVRLALHVELDFQRRYNVHNLTAPRRYDGVWRGTIQQLVTRLEDTRKTCIPI